MSHPTLARVAACSSSAAEGAERAVCWRALLDTRLLSRAAAGLGRRLASPSYPAVSAKLGALVAADRECCAFLDLAVERFDDALILDVSGPSEAADVIAAMFGSAA